MTTDDLATAVGNEAGHELASALGKLKHCLGQLTDEQVSWRSHPCMNSISNLILIHTPDDAVWFLQPIGPVFRRFLPANQTGAARVCMRIVGVG